MTGTTGLRQVASAKRDEAPSVSLQAEGYRNTLPALVGLARSDTGPAIAEAGAVYAGGQSRGLLGLTQLYVGAETAAPLAAALVVGAVHAPAKNGTALEALALILEPVLGPTLRAVDLHLGPPLLRRHRDRHASPEESAVLDLGCDL
jgi:hypothetical protein